ncbi:MAG: hypothetical protein J7K73_02400 [Nanoarchaeota archaeon]|nr:hypothetical protein [Nanoarchaeota archaeon]
MKIKISTPVYPTEDEDKIVSALEKFFPIKFKKRKDTIIGEATDIEVLKELKQKIQDTRIKNTVLYLIEKNKDKNESRIELNKQTLVIGKIHFVEEDYALGNVTIEFDNVEKVAEYLCE